MDNKQLISLEQLCSSYEVEITFFRSLDEYGLMRIVRIESAEFIEHDQLGELDRLLRLHRELDINLEGIGAISHLLERVEAMQKEINALKNKLKLYE
jgi:chaperone modulatory protein CbpM